MTKKEITIQGKQYPVIFTLATLCNFEEITSQAFFGADLNIVKNRIALIMAAVLAADEDSKLTVEDIRGNEDLEAYQQITQAFIVIGELSKEFFKVTDEDKKAEAEEQGDNQEGEQGKN